MKRIENRPRIVERRVKAGDPICARGVIDQLNYLTEAIENLEVKGGRVEWRNRRPRIIMDGQ